MGGIILWFVVASAPVFLTVYLVQAGLGKRNQLKVVYLILSTLILIGLSIFIWRFSESGGLDTALVLLSMVFMIIAATVGAVWLAWKLEARRKLLAVVYFPVFPLLMFSVYKLGETMSPHSETDQHAAVIIEALNQYRVAEGEYPERLEFLIPDYLDDLPAATTNRSANWYGGWLYVSDGPTFRLAYTDAVDRYGAVICSYASSAEGHDCTVVSWREWDVYPHIPPTTQLCIDDKGEWINVPACNLELEYAP